MAQFQRTPEDAEQLLDDILIEADEGASRFPGMTYEQGVASTLQWLLEGWDSESPIED